MGALDNMGEGMKKNGFLLVECAVALVLLATVGLLLARFLGTEACRTVRFAYARALIDRMAWVAEGGDAEEKVPGVTVTVQTAQQEVMLSTLLPSVHTLDTDLDAHNNAVIPVSTVTVRAHNGSTCIIKHVARKA